MASGAMTAVALALAPAFAPITVAACGFDPSSSVGGWDGGDDGGARPDAANRDAGGPSASHLLLTEVKTGPDSLEFIEIMNPMCADVDLTTYYLSDDPWYPLLPSWGAAPPFLGDFDAVLRFPSGAILMRGTVAVIARNGSDFAAVYGTSDFAITNPAGAAMMEVVAHGSAESMSIAPSGEPIALFEWDGEADLVRDVDLVMAGDAPVAEHRVMAKQVLAPFGLDGPDEGTVGTYYRNESPSLPDMLARDATGGSYQRATLEGDHEVASGGNGIAGHDETSEDTTSTWEQAVGTTPTPRTVAPALEVSCPAHGGE